MAEETAEEKDAPPVTDAAEMGRDFSIAFASCSASADFSAEAKLLDLSVEGPLPKSSSQS